MIVDEPIKVKIIKRNIEHYKSKGYEVELGLEIFVSSRDLTPSNTTLVTRICDECGQKKILKFSKASDLCKKCATTKANKKRRDDSKTTCECGNKKYYYSDTCMDCWKKIDKTGENSPCFGVKNPHLSSLENRQQGKTHWNWKGGISKRSGEQIAWSKAVKELADNLCDCCGYSRGVALEAHHLYSDNTDKGDFTLDNGVSLCSNCHKEFHKKYGFGDNTPDQYIEFKRSYHE
jgi:hypothetical protein